MIICYFDADRPRFSPFETDSVLIVNMNAVLTSSVFRQSFKLISGWYLQLWENPNRIQLIELSHGNFPEQPRTEFSGLFRVPAVKDVFRAPVFEGPDHDAMIAR